MSLSGPNALSTPNLSQLTLGGNSLSGSSDSGGITDGYFTDNAYLNPYFTDDAKANRYVTSGGEPFFPNNIADLELWLDPSDTATITQSGGSVSAWADKSGNGYNATQATGSSQPLTGNLINGLNSIDFDGTSDKMGLPSGLYTINQSANSLFYVFKMDTVKNTRAVVGGSGSNNQRWGAWFDSGAGALKAYGGSGTSADTANGVITYNTSQHIYCQIGDGSIFYGSYDNNVFTPDGAFATITFDRLFLGVNDSNNDYLNGRLGEVLIYSRALTPGEIGQVWAYLRRKWGTP